MEWTDMKSVTLKLIQLKNMQSDDSYVAQLKKKIIFHITLLDCSTKLF